MITPERWKQIKKILQEVMSRPIEEQGALIEERCGGDSELRNEIRSLLETNEAPLAFIDKPAARVCETPDPDPREDAESGRTTVGPYRVIRELGRGGMGVVYLAERADDSYRRKVAIKVLKRGMDTDDILARFHKERQIHAELEHPNIARLYEGGATVDGLPYLVMEYVAGVPLHHYCDARRLDIKHRIDLFFKVCAAVHFAHQNLIVHRDIKPSNILVTEDGDVKLLDFGIAKILQPDASGSGAVTATALRIMTPEYASPEQVRGLTITTASDIYSLGVLLYELLTGHRPCQRHARSSADTGRDRFDDEPEKPSDVIIHERTYDTTERGNQHPTAETISRVRGRDLAKLRGQLAGDLDNIVLMALRKEPQRRYLSVAQLSEDLSRYLNGLPIRARKVTFAYLAGKFVKRHRFAVASACLAMFLIFGFSVAMVLQQKQTARARDRAEHERDRAELERDKARQTTDFLINIFESADPYKTPEKITADELLKTATTRIKNDLRQAPETRAALMDTIGVVYENLGVLEKATSLLKQAKLIREEIYHGDGLEVAESHFHLGRALTYAGDYEAAEADLHRALAIRTRILGAEHADVAEVRYFLGLLSHERGRLDEAKTYYSQAHEILVPAGGDDDLSRSRALLGLAGVEMALGNFDESESLFRKAIALSEAVLGANHPEVAVQYNQMGMLHYYRGDLLAAKTAFTKALTIQRETLGHEHLTCVDSLINVAVVEDDLGRFDEAESGYRKALAVKERLLGKEHPTIAQILNNISVLRVNRKRYDGVETLLHRALAINEQAFGRKNPQTGITLNNLGWLAYHRERYEESADYYQQCLDVYHHIFAGDHLEIGKTLSNLGRTYTFLGRYAEAETLFLQSLAIQEKVFGPDHINIGKVLFRIAFNYHRWQKPGTALSYCARASEILETHCMDTYDLVEVLEVQAEILAQLGREQDAASFRSRAKTLAGVAMVER